MMEGIGNISRLEHLLLLILYSQLSTTKKKKEKLNDSFHKRLLLIPNTMPIMPSYYPCCSYPSKEPNDFWRLICSESYSVLFELNCKVDQYI